MSIYGLKLFNDVIKNMITNVLYSKYIKSFNYEILRYPAQWFKETTSNGLIIIILPTNTMKFP